MHQPEHDGMSYVRACKAYGAGDCGQGRAFIFALVHWLEGNPGRLARLTKTVAALQTPENNGMNKQRRKAVSEIQALVCEARTLLEDISQAEREAVDAIPENLRESEQAQRAEEIADTLEECLSTLEDVENDLGTALE